MTKIDLKQKAIIALFDLTTREGATPRSVYSAMKKKGFTYQEICAAAEEIKGRTDG